MPGESPRRWPRRAAFGAIAAAAIFVAFMYLAGPEAILRALNRTHARGPYPLSPEAAALHARLTVADMHCDALMWSRDLLERGTRGHVDLPRLLEGNVALQGFTAPTRIPAQMNVDATPDRWDAQIPLTFFQMWPAGTWNSARERALFMARKFDKTVAASGGRLVRIRTREDLDRYLERRALEPAISAGFLGIEGLHCLEGDLASVRALFDAGFRMMAPTHFFDNELGGSAHGMRKMGLSEFGAAVIEAMEKLHILVDLAHASPKMIDDILARAARPVVVSHTGVRGTCDNNRNLTDGQLRAIAANGGVVGIGFWDTATCGHDPESILRAIRYTVDLIGPDHVGLGSDYDGAVSTPFDIAGIGLLTQGLLEAGYGEDVIAKIMGGNMVRLLRNSLPSENDPVPDVVPAA